MIRKTVTLCLTLLLTTGILYSQPLHSGYMSVAAMGMGGSFTTYPRDATMTIVNPALLNRTSFHLTLLSFPFGIDEEAADIVKFLNDHQDDFSRFDSLSKQESGELMRDLEKIDDRWIYTDVTPFLGLTIPVVNFGVAVYGNISPAVSVDQGIILPAAGLKGSMDIGAAIGMGFSLMDYEVGLAMRFYRQGSFERVRISAGNANKAGETLKQAWEEAKDNVQNGFGLDVGIIHSIDDKLDVAITVQDLIGSRSGWIKPNLITGVAYKVHDRIIVCADMNDWFNTQGVAFLQKLDMGAELRWLMFDLRAGVHQGYPVYGFGLNLYLLKFDYAYFGREDGNQPGQIMEYSHRIGFSFGVN